MESKVLDIINKLLDELGMDKLENLSPTQDLKENIGLDSISYADLIVQIDDAFGVDINSDGAINMIQDIYDKLSS